MESMICLKRGAYEGLQICPRWPSSRVLVAPVALEKLLSVQAGLPGEIGLILTRGYESRASKLGWLRKLSRVAGIVLFKFAYANRGDEVEDIFGSNGHDIDGTHLDVSLAVNGSRVRLLPLSVFTPISWQKRRAEKHSQFIKIVKTALVHHGFSIHRNETESHQIHCDLASTERAVAHYGA
jgi:hypothetical protein